MKLVLQRVKEASVRVQGEVVGRIGRGILALVGVARADTEDDAAWCARKTAHIRCFADADGNLNVSLKEAGGAVLAVSQFTLLGECARGRRPSFIGAAPAEEARALYLRYVDFLRAEGVEVETGAFQALMEVTLVNEGPVTLIVESPSR